MALSMKPPSYLGEPRARLVKGRRIRHPKYPLWHRVILRNYRRQRSSENSKSYRFVTEICIRKWVPVLGRQLSERLICIAGQPVFTKHFLLSPSMNSTPHTHLSFVFSCRWYLRWWFGPSWRVLLFSWESPMCT